jgi:hypothetical protein
MSLRNAPVQPRRANARDEAIHAPTPAAGCNGLAGVARLIRELDAHLVVSNIVLMSWSRL